MFGTKIEYNDNLTLLCVMLLDTHLLAELLDNYDNNFFHDNILWYLIIISVNKFVLLYYTLRSTFFTIYITYIYITYVCEKLINRCNNVTYTILVVSN